MKDKERIEEGSGNIFKDLALPNPEIEAIKVRLAVKIFRIIQQKNKNLVREGKKELTQAEIGRLLGIGQSETSKLKNGQYARFSLERLLYFFGRLHYNVDIKLSPAKNTQTYQRVIIKNSDDFFEGRV